MQTNLATRKEDAITRHCCFHKCGFGLELPDTRCFVLSKDGRGIVLERHLLEVIENYMQNDYRLDVYQRVGTNRRKLCID